MSGRLGLFLCHAPAKRGGVLATAGRRAIGESNALPRDVPRAPPLLLRRPDKVDAADRARALFRAVRPRPRHVRTRTSCARTARASTASNSRVRAQSLCRAWSRTKPAVRLSRRRIPPQFAQRRSRSLKDRRWRASRRLRRFWLGLQTTYDLAVARQPGRPGTVARNSIRASSSIVTSPQPIAVRCRACEH